MADRRSAEWFGASGRAGMLYRSWIHRSGAMLWSGETSTSRLRRKLADLAAYLYRADVYPRGAILATGTSAVPGPDITLRAGDTVTISIEGIGTLANPVRQGLFS
jgi:2-dehydro-3-deoxy-D-arabinonate dehydratase